MDRRQEGDRIFEPAHRPDNVGMEKTGGSIDASHPFKEVEDGNMADYHLLSEATDEPYLTSYVEEAFGFLITNVSPLTRLSRRSASKISQPPPVTASGTAPPGPLAPNRTASRTPVHGRILSYLSKSWVGSRHDHLMLDASVSMARPGVHVRLRVAAAAAMITLQTIGKDARNRHVKETV